MYDPVTGQFVTVDRIEDDPNAYRYVRNNPVNNTDPSGQAMVMPQFVFPDSATLPESYGVSVVVDQYAPVTGPGGSCWGGWAHSALEESLFSDLSTLSLPPAQQAEQVPPERKEAPPSSGEQGPWPPGEPKVWLLYPNSEDPAKRNLCISMETPPATKLPSWWREEVDSYETGECVSFSDLPESLKVRVEAVAERYGRRLRLGKDEILSAWKQRMDPQEVSSWRMWARQWEECFGMRPKPSKPPGPKKYTFSELSPEEQAAIWEELPNGYEERLIRYRDSLGPQTKEAWMRSVRKAQPDPVARPLPGFGSLGTHLPIVYFEQDSLSRFQKQPIPVDPWIDIDFDRRGQPHDTPLSNIPDVVPGEPAPRWINVLVLNDLWRPPRVKLPFNLGDPAVYLGGPTFGASRLHCSAENSMSARGEIRVNLHYIKQNLVDRIDWLLSSHPPTDKNGVALTVSRVERLRVANDAANAYIRAVDSFLRVHWGARAKLGKRQYFDNPINSPYCQDWAAAMRDDLLRFLAGNDLAKRLLEIRWGHPDVNHNFILLVPAGSPRQCTGAKEGWNPSDATDLANPFLILDPWQTLLPRAYRYSEPWPFSLNRYVKPGPIGSGFK